MSVPKLASEALTLRQQLGDQLGIITSFDQIAGIVVAQGKMFGYFCPVGRFFGRSSDVFRTPVDYNGV